MNELVILGIYKTHHRGKEGAITREKFVHKYIWRTPPGIEVDWEPHRAKIDRQFRMIYSQLPICTCEKGGFYPIRKEEILEYRDYLRKKAIPLFNRFKMVCEFHTKLADDVGQMNLFETGENDE